MFRQISQMWDRVNIFKVTQDENDAAAEMEVPKELEDRTIEENTTEGHTAEDHATIYEIIQGAITRLKWVEEQLKEILDEDIYEKAFIDAKKDEFNCYVEEESDSDAVAYYKKFINGLTISGKLFETTNLLHEFLLRFAEESTLFGKLSHAREVPNTVDQVHKFSEFYSILYHNIFHELGVWKKLELLLEANKLFGEITGPFQDNPLYSYFKKICLENIETIKELGSGNLLKTIPDIVESISAHHSDDLSSDANKAIKEWLKQTRIIENALTKFSHTSSYGKIKISWLIGWLVYQLHNPVISLLTLSGQIIASLTVMYREQILLTIQQFNLALQKIMLKLDEIEIQSGLKEGYLSSVGFKLQGLIGDISIEGVSFKDICKAFNESVEKFGYQFKENERYPYTRAIQQAREELQKNVMRNAELIDLERIELKEKEEEMGAEEDEEMGVEEDTVNNEINPLPATKIIHSNKMIQTLLSKRVDDAQNKIQEEAKKYQEDILKAKQDLFQEHKKKIVELINDRIAELNKAKERTIFFLGTEDKKIHLLENLRAKLNETAELHSKSSLHDALNMVAAENKYGPANIHLLWEGKTGKVLQSINDILSAPEDRVSILDIELNRLKEKRKETYLFFAGRRKKNIEKHVYALGLLRALLKKEGYTLDAAMSELHASHHPEYLLLDKEEANLLKQIRNIEAKIPNPLLGKIVIDFHHASSPIVNVDLSDQEYIRQKIDQRIAELKRELSGWFVAANIKRKKIDLLEKLKSQMDKHPLLEAALNQLAQEEVSANFYLLFDGRTGTLLKKLQLVDNDAYVKHATDTAISRLYQQRERPALSFFFFSEHGRVEERIQALRALKKQVEDSPQSNFNEILDNWPDQQHKHVLNRYEKKLLHDLRLSGQLSLERKIELDKQSGANVPVPKIVPVSMGM